MKNLILELLGMQYKMEGSRIDEICEEYGITEERFVELLSRDAYCPTLSAAPTTSTLTYTEEDGSEHHFHVGQLCRWAENGQYRIAVCKNVTDTAVEWYALPVKVSELSNDSGYLTSHQDVSHLATKTELSAKQDIISDLATIRSGASKGATALQSVPSEYVTETELTAKGYATTAQVSSAQTAAQNYTDTKIAALVNGAPETLDTLDEIAGALKDNANIVDVLNGSIANKQDKTLKFENLTASSWVSDATYTDYPYRCDVACTGVTAEMYAEVVFSLAQATSGDYAPLCETKANAVSIWSATNTSVTIPTIIITK